MVVTRRMAIEQERQASYQRGVQARYEYWVNMLRTQGRSFARSRWPVRYKVSDRAKRHRLRDDQPKTVRVEPHTRRI